MEAKPYYIYIARCRDGSLYTGIAVDPVRRLRQHVLGAPACARYTSGLRAGGAVVCRK